MAFDNSNVAYQMIPAREEITTTATPLIRDESPETVQTRIAKLERRWLQQRQRGLRLQGSQPVNFAARPCTAPEPQKTAIERLCSLFTRG